MVSPLLLSVLSICYLALLFAVAFYGERKSVYPSQATLRPYIYSLALGVYCTTWTFFGAVGTAVRSGWAYFPIYLGPALLFLLGIPFLRRLIATVRTHNITSIADLVSSRFGKSPALAALITAIALTAAIPYLALQYKAVGTSIDVLTGSDGTNPEWYADTALWVALLMAQFAVLFDRNETSITHIQGFFFAGFRRFIRFQNCRFDCLSGNFQKDLFFLAFKSCFHTASGIQAEVSVRIHGS